VYSVLPPATAALRRFALAIAGGIAVAFIAVMASRLSPPRAPVERAPAVPRSVAVLSVADSADTAVRWLARGVASDLAAALRTRGAPELRVVTSIADVPAQARALGGLLNVGTITL